MTCGLALLLLVGNLDQALLDDIRYGWKSPVLDATMNAISIAAEPIPLLALNCIGALGARGSVREAARLGLVSSGIAYGVMFGIRAAVNRPRPSDPAPDWFDSSFPSGHATGYFALASVYAGEFPAIAPALYTGGLLVMLSRVYLGKHYPLDVLAGAGLGAAAGLLTLRLRQPVNRLLGSAGARVSLFEPQVTAPTETRVSLVVFSF